MDIRTQYLPSICLTSYLVLWQLMLNKVKGIVSGDVQTWHHVRWKWGQPLRLTHQDWITHERLFTTDVFSFSFQIQLRLVKVVTSVIRFINYKFFPLFFVASPCAQWNRKIIILDFLVQLEPARAKRRKTKSNKHKTRK